LIPPFPSIFCPVTLYSMLQYPESSYLSYFCISLVFILPSTLSVPSSSSSSPLFLESRGFFPDQTRIVFILLLVPTRFAFLTLRPPPLLVAPNCASISHAGYSTPDLFNFESDRCSIFVHCIFFPDVPPPFLSLTLLWYLLVAARHALVSQHFVFPPTFCDISLDPISLDRPSPRSTGAQSPYSLISGNLSPGLSF